LGDQVQNKPLYSFGGKSLWTKELEILLLQDLGDYDQLDLIVHSLKDMPTNLPEEFELGCIVEREDPSDAVLMAKNSPYKSLDELPAGSVVGTSSVRRSAQLKKNFPHLIFESIRGNLQTRIRKLDDPETNFKSIILATAGLARLGLDYRISQRLDSSIMYHAVGQGALGIEIRSNDAIMKSILKSIEDKNATICCLAERALLRTLEGGCSVPIGVQTKYDEATKQLNLKSIVISVDGTTSVEDEITLEVDIDSEDYKKQADRVGEILASRLKDKGAKKILDEINFDKINEKDE
jgi:hydroxymethylbilane synthase